MTSGVCVFSCSCEARWQLYRATMTRGDKGAESCKLVVTSINRSEE